MRFDFLAPTRIVFGPGTFDDVGGLAAELGKRALVVVGSRTLERDGTIERLTDKLAEKKVKAATFAVEGEPTVDMVDRGGEMALAEKSDLVVGFGGGSALDAAKAIAGLVTNGGK